MLARLKTELLFVVAGIVLLGVLFVSQHNALNRVGGTNFVTTIGVPLDDVYIHCRYAENLLAGHGFSFNPPEQVTADTSPLWVLLIAAGGLVTNHLEVVAVLLSALAWLLLAPGVYRVAKHVLRLGEGPSIVAGILMLLHGRVLGLAMSGMETSLAIVLALVSVEAHIRSRDRMQPRIREAILLGLGILVRPELLFLAALCGTDWLILLFKKGITPAQIARYCAVFVPFVLAYLALPLTIEGTLSYHSSIVQGFGLRFPPDFYYIFRSYGIISQPYLAWAIVLVFYAALTRYDEKRKHARTPESAQTVSPRVFTARTGVAAVFVIGLPVLQSLLAPQYRHFGRYVFPLIPFVALFLGIIFHQARVFEPRGDSKRLSTLHTVLVYVGVLGAVWFTNWNWISNYGNAVSNINDQHLGAAAWVQSNCSVTDVVAADDVGALGYIAKRNVIDLTGLVSPKMYPLQHDQRLVWQAARAQSANVFVIYTRLNPAFYEYAKDSLELVRTFTVRPPLVSSADTTMSIFRVKGATNAPR